jgi:hypothetical protein
MKISRTSCLVILAYLSIGAVIAVYDQYFRIIDPYELGISLGDYEDVKLSPSEMAAEQEDLRKLRNNQGKGTGAAWERWRDSLGLRMKLQRILRKD